MKSDKYWEGRFIELQKSQLKRADSFAHELEDLHQRMQKEIDDDITVWHKKVATANGISMADAKKLMSRKDRKEFQWTLEEYQQHAKADLLSGVTSANVMNASANWHLTYLDGMKLQLEHHVDKLYKNIDSKTRNHFKESLNDNYLNTAFELQKEIGIGEKMEVPYDERKLENILRTPWASDGKNFSNRIWKDRTQLVNNLQKNLSESVIRGDSDTDMIQALSKDEKKAEFNTRRLVETESAFFDSESERQCCEDLGIEKYRFLAVLDMKTSDICQELDNKVFLEKDRQVGVNAPPMHPFCRSTTVPVVDEEFLTSRRAKNPNNGKYDEIPADMNYKEWKAKYVEGKEPVEKVKQEQVKTNTPNGNSTNDSSSKQNQTIEEFDSKEFRKNYDNRVINKSDVQEPATIEIERPVNYGNTEKIYTDTALPPKQKSIENFNSKEFRKNYGDQIKEKAKIFADKQTVNKFVEFSKSETFTLNEANIPATVSPKIYIKKSQNIKIDQDENINSIKTIRKKLKKNFFENLKDNVKDWWKKRPIIKNLKKEGIKNIFFSKTSFRVAKELESCYKEIFSVMPELKTMIKGTGDIEVFRKKLINIKLKNNIKKYREKTGKYPSNNWIINKKQKIIEKIDEKLNLSEGVLAVYVSKEDFNFTNENLEGIYYFSDKLEKQEDENKDSYILFHPLGCYTIEGSIKHELGHVIYDFLYKKIFKEVEKLYLENKDKGIDELISEYGKNNPNEFFAEVISAGLTSTNVESKSIINEIMNLIKEVYGKDIRL